MQAFPVPSKLYRVYWVGRYIERIDAIVRALLAAAGEKKETGKDSGFEKLASSLGMKFTSLPSFLETLLYDKDFPSSILHAARMIRMNLQGLGIDRLLRESNMLVLLAESKIDYGNMDSLIKHLEDILSAVNSLGRAVENELTVPPSPPEAVLREQLLHQQQ